MIRCDTLMSISKELLVYKLDISNDPVVSFYFDTVCKSV